MTRSARSATFTADYREAYLKETQSILRRQFLLFTGIVLGLSLLILISFSIPIITSNLPWHSSVQNIDGRFVPNLSLQSALTIFLLLIELGAYTACFMFAFRNRVSDQRLLRLSIMLVAMDGLIEIVSGSFALNIMPVTHTGALEIAFIHILACALLPWTPLQAIRPMIAIVIARVAISVVIFLPQGFISAETVQITFQLVLYIFAAIPGIIICWFRHSKRVEGSKIRFLQHRYGEMRRELVDARKIHESLFPDNVNQGPVRFSYEYEPMRQIGGDYLHTHQPDNDDSLSIVLMDVTGHGIPAALTVNRLHGEVARIFAEQPNIEPGCVLSLLNSYVHLTLADHSVFVTALCMRVLPDQSIIQYASGGHPPAFIKTIDGRLDDLESTTFVLGVLDADKFNSEQESRQFSIGDVLVAYTDGANEARNRQGAMLRIQGLRDLIYNTDPDPVGGWPSTIIHAIEQHRAGPPEDDTLVIEITRPLITDESDAIKTSQAQNQAQGVSS